jgi:energy-coupling factor transporter transmembrane protein EcfT
MIEHGEKKPARAGLFLEKRLGTVGYLAIFLSLVAAVMVTPAPHLPWVAAGCLLAAWLFFPQAFRSLLRGRWLAMIALLALPPLFLVGEPDRSLAGIPYSSAGVLSAVQIALRILVVLIAVQGLTSTVDITSVAGLLEKAGLHGLGFSLGVALNLLPALQQSALNAWRSLWMRGGLRKQHWRGLRLLGVTIFANALSRAEEIALAAEVRAYSPERTHSLPVKVGQWDWGLLALGAALILGLVLLP